MGVTNGTTEGFAGVPLCRRSDDASHQHDTGPRLEEEVLSLLLYELRQEDLSQRLPLLPHSLKRNTHLQLERPAVRVLGPSPGEGVDFALSCR
jgi:hypothetical protein